MKLSAICLIGTILVSLIPANLCTDFLRVNGTKFYLGKDPVFLSGVNFAWNSYAYDFGNSNYQRTGPDLEKWVKEVAQNGGNSLRIWLHCEGQNTPMFDSNGLVTAPDREGTLISDLTKFMNVAKENNVFVILVLWNGAVNVSGHYKDLIMNDTNLDSYINHGLLPLVKALKTNPAMAAWEIVNEPEGSVDISETSDTPCYDSTKMKSLGAGWTKSNISLERTLRFINKNAAAIKKEDPKAVVTLGSWSQISQTDAFPDAFNYYKDECLIGAGEEKLGTIDFYQMHTYSWEGKFAANSPFTMNASSYKLDKPLVIGEFSADCGGGMTIEEMWSHSFNKSYNGAWSWQYTAPGGHCSDSQEDQKKGMNLIKKLKCSSTGQVSIKFE